MLIPVFEQSYLLKSLGWAIVNSFWQTGILWLVYKVITGTDKKLPALVKHDLSIALLTFSFGWFIYTFVGNCLSIYPSGSDPYTGAPQQWTLSLQPVIRLLPLVSLLYLGFIFVFSFRFCNNLLGGRLIQTKLLTKAPIDLRLFTCNTALQLGIKKKIQVWLSENVDVPSVTGFIKPVILLPLTITTQLSARQIETVLLHELSHIRRNDYVVNLIQCLFELILFFNPFAVMLGKAARMERENSCDDWVINFQYDRCEYAKALLALEENRHFHQRALILAATNSQKKLLLRVKRLFNGPHQTTISAVQRSKLVGIYLLVVVTMITMIPGMITTNKTAREVAASPSKRANDAFIPAQTAVETPSSQSFANAPKDASFKKSMIRAIRKKRKPAKKEVVTDVVNAYVNEELLSQTSSSEPVITHVINKDISKSRFIIKIDEQQSGKKRVMTYYFEINNMEGNAAIKPLVIVNKSKINKKTVVKPARGILEISRKQVISHRIRITS